MGESNKDEKPVEDATPPAGELSVEDEGKLLEQTVFPEEEYELPDQTPEDIYKEKETDA